MHKTISLSGQQLELIDLAASSPAGEAAAPIVLLHEGLGCVAMWRKFPQALAARSQRRVIAWSRAGYGASDPHPTARTPRYLEEEGRVHLPAVLDALEVRNPVLVGHSDGATIALVCAAEHPERVTAAVAMAPHEFVEAETLAGIRAAREAWQTTDLPQKLARYHRDAARVFADWNDTWLSPAFRDWNIEHLLPAIRCPVLALQGEDDEYATLRQIEVIGERVAQAKLLAIPRCGHSPHLDQPQVVLDAIAAFLANLPEA